MLAFAGCVHPTQAEIWRDCLLGSLVIWGLVWLSLKVWPPSEDVVPWKPDPNEKPFCLWEEFKWALPIYSFMIFTPLLLGYLVAWLAGRRLYGD
jgi:hypothetical protein